MQSAVSRIDLCEENKETVKLIFKRKDKEETIETDLVLIATGRQANVENLGLDATGIEYSPKGINVNDDMETNIKGVYAIGDVNARQMLAHAATFKDSVP